MRRLITTGLCVLAVAGGTAWLPAGRAGAAADAAAPTRPAGVTAGATSALLYDFGFAGTTGTVGNTAPDGPALQLGLSGSWWRVPGGVHFSGDTTGHQSIAYGRLAHGDTIDASGSTAIGFGAKIRYEKPASGTCFHDTPNVTQIGRFSARKGGGQAKLQLSNCVASRSQVFVECRFSGAASAAATPPVVGTVALVSGATYDVSCVKSPDSQGHTAVTIQVTSVATGTTTENRSSIARVGAIVSTQYLSAANKYPLPAPAHNTDQFVGNMTRAVYCVGTLHDVLHCLSAYLTH